MKKAILGTLIALAGITGSAQMYSKPTYGQVERCIGAVQEVQGDTAAYTAACARAGSLYSYPTYEQIERLIGTIRAGTNVFDAAGARYLSIWDCTTGLPLSNRTDVVYRPGDVYVVGSAYAHPVTNALYCHTLEMHGWTQGPNVYTNLVFAFTNAVAAPYVTFDDVVTAANAVASGKKDSFPASGEILDSIESNVVVRALDAHVTPDIQLMLGDGTMSYGTKGTATNATYLVDTVTLVGLSGQLNYKPAGARYVEGVASTNVESETVGPNATYWYDGTDWQLLPTGTGEVDLSSRTTFQQATNISEHVVTNNVATWARTRETAPLTGVTINGTSLPVSGRTASGTVVTCSPLPDGTQHENVSTLTLCKSLATNPTVIRGMMYLGHAGLTEGDDITFPRGGEVTVKCLQADRDLTRPDNVTAQGCVILELTFTSTGTGLRHWMCVYEYFGLDHPLNNHGAGLYPNGKPAFGTTSMPWYGIPFRPFPGQETGPNPLSITNTAALLTDVWASTNVMKDQTFNLTDDAELRNAVKKLVQALGGTVTE